MKQEFLDTLKKKTINYEEIFAKLHKGVIETNKLIGIGLDNLDEEQREKLIETYFKLRVEECKEVEEAIEKEDKTNLVNELIDVLVVAGYEYYLDYGAIYNSALWYQEDTAYALTEIIGNSGDRWGCSEVLEKAQEVLSQIDCNLEKAVDEVLRANLSKFPTCDEIITTLNKTTAEYLTGDTAIEYQIYLLEKGGRYSGVTCEKVIDSKGEERLVFWSEKEYGVDKKKYLKAATYVEANLNGIWE